jgi:hypothetical protein
MFPYELPAFTGTQTNITIVWQFQQEEGSFHQQTGLKFKEETSKLLHLEHSFVWC